MYMLGALLMLSVYTWAATELVGFSELCLHILCQPISEDIKPT